MANKWLSEYQEIIQQLLLIDPDPVVVFRGLLKRYKSNLELESGALSFFAAALIVRRMKDEFA